jgi:hypothetical protein
MRILARPHQHQLIERHILHGACGRPDVAGMRSLDQDDADVMRHDLLS